MIRERGGGGESVLHLVNEREDKGMAATGDEGVRGGRRGTCDRRRSDVPEPTTSSLNNWSSSTSMAAPKLHSTNSSIRDLYTATMHFTSHYSKQNEQHKCKILSSTVRVARGEAPGRSRREKVLRPLLHKFVYKNVIRGNCGVRGVVTRLGGLE